MWIRPRSGAPTETGMKFAETSVIKPFFCRISSHQIRFDMCMYICIQYRNPWYRPNILTFSRKIFAPRSLPFCLLHFSICLRSNFLAKHLQPKLIDCKLMSLHGRILKSLYLRLIVKICIMMINIYCSVSVFFVTVISMTA